MQLLSVLDHVHDLLRQVLRPGDLAVDATVGNGHDTRVLAGAVGPTGHVYGFDVQAEALAQARQRLQEADLASRVTLFEAGHEAMAVSLPAEARGEVRAVTFNLGYLPGSDKAIITRPDTTLSALNQATALLSDGGLLTVVLYWKHAGGRAEAESVLQWAAMLDTRQFTAQHIQTLNRHLPPTLLMVERHQA